MPPPPPFILIVCPAVLFQRRTHKLYPKGDEAVKRQGQRFFMAEKTEKLLDLPVGVLTADPHIEWNGKRQILVENGCRLQVYEEDCICLQTACGILQILGHKLCLSALSTDSVAICGQIVSVEYIE